MKTICLIAIGAVGLIAFCSEISTAKDPQYYRALPTPGAPPAMGYVSAARSPLPGTLTREREAWLVTGERWAVVLVVDYDGMRIVRAYSREGVRWLESKSYPFMVSKVRTPSPRMDPHPQLTVDMHAISDPVAGTVYTGRGLRITDQLCTPLGCDTHSFSATGDTSVL